MSGLLERIVRRRRASASSRLGPPTQNGHPSPHDVPYLNGHAPERSLTHVNGSAGTAEVPEAEPPAAEVPGAEPPAVEVPGAEPHAVEVPGAEPPLEDFDEPAPIEDEPPTMEHRVLVLEALEDEAAEVDDDDAEEAPDEEPEPVARYQPEAILSVEPAVPPGEHPAPEPHFRGRSRVRRRARYLRRLREIQLRDIGGFAVELHRFGRERPDLLAAKIADAAQTDAELRALEEALGEEEPLRELREAGIGGVCSNCGAVHGSDDHFCATCGEPVGHEPRASHRSSEFDDYFGQG